TVAPDAVAVPCALIETTRRSARWYEVVQVNPQLVLRGPRQMLVEHREELRLVASVLAVCEAPANVIGAEVMGLRVVGLVDVDGVDVRPAAASESRLVVEVDPAQHDSAALVHEVRARGADVRSCRVGAHLTAHDHAGECEEAQDQRAQLSNDVSSSLIRATRACQIRGIPSKSNPRSFRERTCICLFPPAETFKIAANVGRLT